MLVLPLTIFGSSGGTRTVTLAYRERIAGVPVNRKIKWQINFHWQLKQGGKQKMNVHNNKRCSPSAPGLT